jgi:4-deoxy-L-threo-5-hexosulose-uronate ketol-isomerase
MEIRYTTDPESFRRMTSGELRTMFLAARLFRDGQMNLLYTDVDRALLGGIVPTAQSLELKGSQEMASEYFCERREAGIINTGAPGTIVVDGKTFEMGSQDCLYIGRGAQCIAFFSNNKENPARYYLLSYPAHASFPTTHARKSDAQPVRLGSSETSNVRTIYKYIHPSGIRSSQLVMGMTFLESGSVWNTMSAHTHERRTEIYLYFDVPEKAVVFHFMGQPHETRHLVVRDRQAILSPSWSIHSGVGTASYKFIWGMGGENQDFDDMDSVSMDGLS